MKSSDIIIGRIEEKRTLERLYRSKNAEFLAIYGRRRIGKTFLIRNFFKRKGVFFEITGSFNANTKEQLENFHTEFTALFDHDAYRNAPKTWREAFRRLVNSVNKIQDKQKIIIFFDELPWLASSKSGFLEALDYAWNRHFSALSKVLLIVSGSAASWMISHVVNNTGGLYGRLSAHLRLLPFSLSETEAYLKSREISLTRKQICEIYMVTGGVPKYLSYIERGLSANQNIHYLCFSPQSPLLTEFHKLYYSLFQSAESHLKIVKALAAQRRGLSRLDLLKKAKLSNSGRSSDVLRELEESGFISTLPEIGKKAKGIKFYLNDEYTLFYLKWIEPDKGNLLKGVEKEYWIKRQSLPSWKSWAGFAFESLCLKHIAEIKEALRIGGVTTSASYWKAEVAGKKEIEVDLVIDRADQCINLCEIKFSNNEFVLTKAYSEELNRKKTLFQKFTGTSKGLFLTLITPFGAKENTHFHQVVDHQLTLDALFS
ncbi:MAG: AAA family ATPase [Chlamydiales bacterium]|nr:AAA family ATPase [Chlamydiales bacterium]